MIPAAPGHNWKRATTGWCHQFPIEAVPDSEGVLTAKCGNLAVLDRNPDYVGSLCPTCLMDSPSEQLANRMERHASALPAAARATTNAAIGLDAPARS